MNRFLGIQFRSRGHETWLKGTMGILLVVAIITALNRVSKHPYEQIYVISGSLAFSSLGMSVIALVLTRGGRKNGDILSRDCIWYNLLLGCIYVALAFSYQR